MLVNASRVWLCDPGHASKEWVANGAPLIAGALLEGDLIGVPMSAMDEALRMVQRLIGPGGCPWDQEQTHQSLRQHLLEETYEVLEAIDANNVEALREELGDVLLQPLMHSEIATTFSMKDVCNLLVDKLYRRHPHVFGEVQVGDSVEVLQNWDAIKKSEKGGRSVLSGIPKAMPALLRAHEVSKRAARAGFEWQSVEGVFEKLDEEETELREAIVTQDHSQIKAEIGDMLFTIVNIARWLKIEPEEALAQMVDRFSHRFEQMESATDKPLGDLSFSEWDELWNRAKSSV